MTTSDIHRVCWREDLSLVKLLANAETVNSKVKNGNTPLHVACQCRKLQIIKFLVGVDASIVNVRNENGDTPLHLVCSASLHYTIETSDHKLYNLAECLIGDNAECDVSITNSNNESALHLACAAPTMPLKVIKLLLSRSTSDMCNSTNHSGDTPLHIACRRASPAFADYLVKSQLCNPDIQNNEEELPLHIACRKSKSFNGVIKMLSGQCKLNCTNSTGDTPLHILCRNGNLEAIKTLVLIPHCDTGIQNHNGELPLHLACSFSRKIVELAGAHYHHSPNIQTMSGDTLLHVACKQGNLDGVKYLTENMHCDASIQNNSGLLPLHYASHHSEAMVRLVRNCNPDIQCISEHEFKYQLRGKSSYPSTCKIEAGDTPLHVACRKGTLKVISFLVNEMKCDVNIPNANEEMPLHIACCSYGTSLETIQLMRRCNPNAQTKCGDTPLHLAVRHRASSSVVQYLVKQMKCNVNTPNKSGKQPLHILLHQGYIYKGDLVPLVSNSLNINSEDEHGNTPLHTACLKFSREAIECFSKIKGCDLNITNKDGDIPLHVACRMCNSRLEPQDELDIVKLVSASNANVNARNLAGNTPLHEVCQRRFDSNCKCLEIVKYLILEKKCNLSISNERQELPLHLATRKNCLEKGHLETVKLVSGVDDVNSQTTSGNTPLHEACHLSDVEIVKHLILEKKCNPSIPNERYELPIHLASRRGRLEAVKLVSGVDDVNSQTTSGNTPLHEACMSNFYGLKELLEFLIEKGCNPKCQNGIGRTPLHYLCENSRNIEATEYLLSKSTSEFSVADNEGQTPIMLTTDLSITKILLRHGADATPLYEMHRTFFKTKTPPPTPLNVLVVGNASMGKTTLIESLKNELCETVLAEPELHTAGIIPNDFESEIYGSVTFYDFAGQHEYYASHEAVVHNIIKHSPPAILLLINITEPKHEIWKKMVYWTALIEGRCTTLREKPHLVVVGSYLDQVKEPDRINALETLSVLIDSLQSRLEESPLRYITHVAMDCRQAQSQGIKKLRQVLRESSAKLRDNAVMNFTCHCFCVFLQDKLNHFTALPVERITNAITAYAVQDKKHNITENILSTNTQDIVAICEELSNMGHLLFLKNPSRPEMSWVILKKERLLSTVNGTVFAPHSFKQHKDLSSSTGVVPLEKIATYFPRYDPNMIVGFLSHLEFCQEIHDPEVLDLLTPHDRPTGPYSSTQRYFFFPALVSIETPQGVWKPDPNYGYQWGWMLHCTNSEEFFTPHFLQVLILRLAFSFAMTTPKLPYLDNVPAIKRACSVWKRGIRWTCTEGVEATVEVIEQNQAVVAMVRSYKTFVSEVECIQLRSLIMRKVLQAKQTFCPNITTAESVIHPRHLHYPLPCIREISHFPIPIVARAVVHINPCALTESGELFGIEELVRFEPYSCLGEGLLQILFHQEDEKKTVTEVFLRDMAAAIVVNTGNYTAQEFKKKVFMKVFKSTHDSDLESKILFRIFQAWRRSHSDGTYKRLRQLLDDFSLFHGRNPLVSTGH